MKINYIKFRNFEGYGSDEVFIDFNKTHGFMLLLGDNGTGKSSLTNTITFALYGKVPDKQKIKNIVNRYNRCLETEINVTANNRNITIIRNLDPDLFEISEGGQPVDYAHKKTKQEFLDDEIYGITYSMFTNIVALSVNDFQSFTKKMSPTNKRNIIDRIFGIELLSKIFLENKNIINSKRTDISNLDSSMNELARVIQKSNDRISILIKENESINFEKKLEYTDTISKLSDEMSNLSETIKNDKLKKADFEAKLIAANREYNKLEVMRNDYLKKMKLYENNQCPTCEASLKTESHLTKLNDYKHKISQLNKQEADFFDFKNKINKYITDVKVVIDNTDNEIFSYNQKLSVIKTELRQIESFNPNENNEISNLINETQERLDDFKKEADKLNSELRILKIVHNILNESGVKMVIIDKLIPSFNVEIKSILNKLGVNHEVTIDNKFNTSIKYLGYDISIDSLSTGQLKKIDISIVLTFIKILKTKYSDLNILFLDEIFSSIDSEGRYSILSLLKGLCDDYNLNIIVVNHSELPLELFDWKIQTSMTEKFSKLEIEKIV